MRKIINQKHLRVDTKIHDYQSEIYNGNVTFRIDSAWGLSGISRKPRSTSKRLNRSTRPTSSDLYNRCKDTQRCSRGLNEYNQSEASAQFTMQVFPGGLHRKIPLFVDFEDWRSGPFLSKGENLKTEGLYAPKGSYWSPFQFESLGPSIPSFNTSYNSGLVLNKDSLNREIKMQENWIYSILEYLKWLKSEVHITSLEAKTRTRLDIQEQMNRTILDYENILREANEKLIIMKNSQCRDRCRLHFNTSSLELSGSINATGTVRKTLDETEVSVWTFDSIDLGKEVFLYVTGQRAIALYSKSSAYIDTKINVNPGTLGGFPGGYSLFRGKDRFSSVCREDLVDLDKKFCSKSSLCCLGDRFVSNMNKTTISNNINGPGSNSLRYYLFT